MNLQRLDLVIQPDNRRVLLRPFVQKSNQRNQNIINRVFTLSEEEAETALHGVRGEFGSRHRFLEPAFLKHCELIADLLPPERSLSRTRKLLIGSIFTCEYAVESAALFNPSIVPHPDQAGLADGELRFILSLRATGEGHISSIEFRSGIIDTSGYVHLEPAGQFVTSPEIVSDPSYDKSLFKKKIDYLDNSPGHSGKILGSLPGRFTRSQLNNAFAEFMRTTGRPGRELQRVVDDIKWIADSNYEVCFSSELPVSERILFPVSANESNGIEDARFVRFTGDDGSTVYYATYTAYNGHVIHPQLLETTDFIRFKIGTLTGRDVQNKGMALFPRKINGSYAMVSRQDGEQLYLMYSDDVYTWNNPVLLYAPKAVWEVMQIGNCGSPIETDRGWLLLTHGVGPVRKYCIGAILLDKDDPSKVRGWLREPLLAPDASEREGYVPNVVYTCGALQHAGWLIVPYAMSDYASSFARVRIDEVLNSMEPL